MRKRATRYPTDDTYTCLTQARARLSHYLHHFHHSQDTETLINQLALHCYCNHQFHLLFDKARTHISNPELAGAIDEILLDLPDEPDQPHVIQRLERLMCRAGVESSALCQAHSPAGPPDDVTEDNLKGAASL
jgi:hypothetical protein